MQLSRLGERESLKGERRNEEGESSFFKREKSEQDFQIEFRFDGHSRNRFSTIAEDKGVFGVINRIIFPTMSHYASLFNCDEERISSETACNLLQMVIFAKDGTDFSVGVSLKSNIFLFLKEINRNGMFLSIKTPSNNSV
ncbi:hypothetical protein CEXT_62091 [Caerostris extrusa]|uniref:Uncharacterized protein n=1 Tax=Caerostris extrusa TaxID=172846 RepID=A0AAV4RBS3_CAEEX|nr:hypothetical protein CEXT_62091 [Caerostris extrusa]